MTNGLTIRKLNEDDTPLEPAPEKPHFPSVLDDPVDAGWKRMLLAMFGHARALTILHMKRCKVCQGRLRPYTDPKVGAGSNRDFGVKPGLRCNRCGRMA